MSDQNSNKIPGMETLEVEIRNLIEDIKDIREDIKMLHKRIEECRTSALVFYVSKEQFAPIKNIVYGMVGIILTGVIGAILLMVIGKG